MNLSSETFLRKRQTFFNKKKHTKYFLSFVKLDEQKSWEKQHKRSRNWNEKKGKENKRTNKQIEYEKFSKEATTSPLVVVRATIANNFCISHTFLSRSWTETTPFVKIVSWRSELKQFKSLKRTRKIFKFYQKNNLGNLLLRVCKKRATFICGRQLKKKIIWLVENILHLFVSKKNHLTSVE